MSEKKHADTEVGVAFDLMKTISDMEYPRYKDGEVRKDRKYWLDLYHECLTATKGHHKIESKD